MFSSSMVVFEWKMAGGPGFEPGLRGSEPRVLPLNYPPVGTGTAYLAKVTNNTTPEDGTSRNRR